MTTQQNDTLSTDRGPIAPRPGAPAANRQQMIMAAAIIGGGVLAGGYVKLAPAAPAAPP